MELMSGKVRVSPSLSRAIEADASIDSICAITPTLGNREVVSFDRHRCSDDDKEKRHK